MAKGYILAMVSVADMERYRASGYMAMAEAAVAAHGGRFLIRGGAPEALEGAPVAERLVVLEFPDRETARRFYYSPEYAPAIARRNEHSSGRFTLLEEFESPPRPRM